MTEITLDDVARESGVSRATASRAINGRSGVRDDVRERVRTVADALGYRPNRSARNLAGGRASLVGLVLGRDTLADNPYIATLLHEVAAAADRSDEGLMLLMDSEHPSEAVRKMVADGLVDGVIVSVMAVGHRWVEELLNANMPTVLIGAHPDHRDVSAVEVENRESSAALVGHMLDNGCRRLGTITGFTERPDSAMRLEGFRLAHERRSLTVDESLVVAGDFSLGSGFRHAEGLLQKGPDGIFCANDQMAIGALRQAARLGISVPDQLSVAGFDGTASDEFTPTRITSIRQPFPEMAERAMKLLIAEMTDAQQPEVHLIEPTIFYGDTTRNGTKTDTGAGKASRPGNG